jgi:hypothetical protein
LGNPRENKKENSALSKELTLKHVIKIYELYHKIHKYTTSKISKSHQRISKPK